ncbi:MAG: hypothetical protein ACI3V3_04225 [Faecousia sp.]
MNMTINDRGIRILTPADGKYLTNGETYSQRVYLGKSASADDWREVDSIPDEADDPELTDEEAIAELLEVLK